MRGSALKRRPAATELSSEGDGGAEDGEVTARAASLHYVSDAAPGIRRVRRGRSFSYYGLQDTLIRDEAERLRIRSLAIPPAWTDVWICADSRGHLQATGRDSKGRKQYRYHARWREARDENKFGRLAEFADALDKIRCQTERDLARPGLPEEKVLAAVVQLLEATLIRVGNDDYARDNGSFGLTTIRTRHVSLSGARIDFNFRGKSGKVHSIAVRERRLANVVRRCRELPGHELFQYIGDDGTRHRIDSTDVNEYLKSVSGKAFTAKDFRTWFGTVLTYEALCHAGRFETEAAAKQNVVRAVAQVAERLGNTPAVCRKCYIHPAVIEGYLEGTAWQPLDECSDAFEVGSTRLSLSEAAVRALLRHLGPRT